MIPLHPFHRARRRYYRRVVTAVAFAASIHAAAFVLAPAYVARPIAIAPSPLRLVRLAATLDRSETPAPPTPPAPAPAAARAPRALPEMVSATRIVTEPAPATPAARSANPKAGSIPSAGGTIESEDADPPVFYQYDTAPRIIRRVEPDYPAAVRARGEEGSVVVNANVDERGRVIRAWVVAQHASEALVSAVIDAVYQFEFTPGEERGTPVRCTVAIPFRFSLKNTP